MATKTIQTCDICGANATTTATVTLDGATTEVDLCAKHARAMTVATKPYVSVGRTIGRPRTVAAKKTTARKVAAKKTSAKKSGATKTVKKAPVRKRTTASSRVAEIRAWGYANGFNVASKGRLKPDLVEAFEAANG